MRHTTERAAIAASLSERALLSRVRDVAGDDIGDPLHDPHDSARLRERFGLTIEYTHSSVLAFTDNGVCAALKTQFPDSQVWARRAACVAVASMWTPAVGKAAKAAKA